MALPPNSGGSGTTAGTIKFNGYDVGPHDSIFGNLSSFFARARNGQLAAAQVGSLRSAMYARIMDIVTINARMGHPNPLLDIPDMLDPTKPFGQMPPIVDEATFRLRLTEAIAATAGIVADPGYTAAVSAVAKRTQRPAQPTQQQGVGTPVAGPSTPGAVPSPALVPISTPPQPIATPVQQQQQAPPPPMPAPSAPVGLGFTGSPAPVAGITDNTASPVPTANQAQMSAANRAQLSAAAVHQMAAAKGLMHVTELTRISRMKVGDRDQLLNADPALKANYEKTMNYFRLVQQQKAAQSRAQASAAASGSQPPSLTSTPTMTPGPVTTPSFPTISTPVPPSIPSTPPTQISSAASGLAAPTTTLEPPSASSAITTPSSSQPTPETKPTIPTPTLPALPLTSATPAQPSTSTPTTARPSPVVAAAPAPVARPPRPAPPPETPGARVKRKINEYLAEQAPELTFEVGADDILTQVLDSFLDRVATDTVRMAVHRKSDRVETRDIAYVLDSQYDLVVPGFNAAVPKRVHLEPEGRRGRVVAPRTRQKEDDA